MQCRWSQHNHKEVLKMFMKLSFAERPQSFLDVFKNINIIVHKLRVFDSYDEMFEIFLQIDGLIEFMRKEFAVCFDFFQCNDKYHARLIELLFIHEVIGAEFFNTLILIDNAQLM